MQTQFEGLLADLLQAVRFLHVYRLRENQVAGAMTNCMAYKYKYSIP